MKLGNGNKCVEKQPNEGNVHARANSMQKCDIPKERNEGEQIECERLPRRAETEQRAIRDADEGAADRVAAVVKELRGRRSQCGGRPKKREMGV
jgi:hypothetical protein